ncbi:hypothetical protein BD770DRAFT_394948, partial [Pilaira anomala]
NDPFCSYEKLCELEICYTDDPYKPMLQTKVKVNGFPSYYHLYKDDLPDTNDTQEQININNRIQLTQYLNRVYRPDQPVDSVLYEEKQVSMKHIYSETVLITDLFDDKTSKFVFNMVR